MANLFSRARQSLSAIALWPLKTIKRIGIGSFKKLRPIGSWILKVAKKACVSSFKKLKSSGMWVWSILKRIVNWIKKRRPGTQVAIAIASFSIIGCLVIISAAGGLQSNSGIGEVLIWLLLTPLVVFGAIGIGYGIWTKKISSRNLFWTAAILIPLLLVGCVWWFWDSILKLSQTIFHPTFADMLKVAIPFAIVIATIVIFTYLFKGDWATKIRKVALSVVVLFVGITLLLLYADWGTIGASSSHQVQQPTAAAISAPQECTKSHHCSPIMLADGSTEKVPVPVGKTACFDSFSWDNRSEIGLRTSRQGGPEEEHTCTREEVIAGTCHETPGDAFRFVPKTTGIRLPQYWFIEVGQSAC